MMQMKHHVIVAGGGASGMMAAIVARRHGAKVTLLERNPRVGKKILATGNGRCNYTNINTALSCYQGNNPHFAQETLTQFDVTKTIEFFEKLGIAHKIEDLGKVFPRSDQASSVLDVLLYELQALSVEILCDSFVEKIRRKNGIFKIKLKNGTTLTGDRVILASGGKAMPSSGSDGSGYPLAQDLGHTVTPLFPGLVQLKLSGNFFKQIEGVKFVGKAELIHQEKVVAWDRGDILFGNYGVSGPPILQISRKAGAILEKNQIAQLKLSIIDHLSQEELSELLTKRFQNSGTKTLFFSLVGLINKRLIPVLLKESGISDIKVPAIGISSHEVKKIATILTDWRFVITGTKGWPHAQVTAGGINTKEINPQSMESKLVPGLYFAGEIIDIDGMCGGYNLQWAWSSGFVAGRHAALR
ncbi:MAG: NAD(P)/FAD-dependent oxidoreductase [Dehalobacterium sp.]|jgi:predicted Rossmann fold flavoprotein